MHTAFTLRREMFDVEIDGCVSDRAALFAASRHERIGVVVTEPLGGLGASFLIQLGITAYYDADRVGRSANPHYPELYFFHVGGSFGEYSVMDAWPARKQIFLPDDGAETLASINSHAITHLILPDRMRFDAVHGFAEPNAAIDRLERCYLYDACGHLDGGNITVRSKDTATLDDVFGVINLPEALPEMISSYPDPDDPAERLDNETWIALITSRLSDVDPALRSQVSNSRRTSLDNRGALETYREISVREAVTRLGRTSAT